MKYRLIFQNNSLKDLGYSLKKSSKFIKMLNSVTRIRMVVVLVSFTTLLFYSPLTVVSQNTFHRAIGMESFEKGNALEVLADGSFILAGETEEPQAQERDMMLMRVDSNGSLRWTRTFGGPERETVNDVLQMPDRGFLMLAEKYQPDKQEGENLTLIKTDKDGNLMWKKIFDEGGIETEGFSMQQTQDRNYIITGMVKSSNVVSSAFFSMSAEDQGLYLLKIDGNGNKIWSRRFDYGADNISSTGTSVIAARDGSYIAVGNIARKGRTDKKIERPAKQINMQDVRNMLLAKVKPNGTLQWAREFEGNSITMGYVVIEKAEGGYMVAGNTNVTATNIDMFLISIDANGNVQWAKTYGAPRFESMSDIVQTTDGGFVATGITHSLGSGSADVLSFKTDKQGSIVWAKTYGGASEEYPSKIALSGSGIVTVGSTTSKGSEGFDLLFMKTDKNGECGSFEKDAKLIVENFQPVSRKIEKASMIKVEQGILPPNMKKPDVNNIVEHRREARVKELGD